MEEKDRGLDAPCLGYCGRDHTTGHSAGVSAPSGMK